MSTTAVLLAPLVISEAPPTPVELPPCTVVTAACGREGRDSNNDANKNNIGLLSVLIFEDESSPLSSIIVSPPGKRVKYTTTTDSSLAVVHPPPPLAAYCEKKKRDFVSIGLTSLLNTNIEEKKKTFAEIISTRFSAFQAVTPQQQQQPSSTCQKQGRASNNKRPSTAD